MMLKGAPMTIYTDVPLIRQEKQMSCWHASARMLWGFKYKQSINPLKKLYKTNNGIAPKEFVKLAKTLGLESVKNVNMSFSWSALAELLRRHGPLWVAGYWYGPAHIIVVTGVAPDGKLYLNDPAGAKKTENLTFFNTKIAKKVPNPIMYLPDSRANAHGFGTFFE